MLPRDIIEILPEKKPPEWAPPIGLRVAAELDEVVLKFCKAEISGSEWNIDWPSLCELIRFIWSKRLPLEANEVWLVLRAYGMSEDFKEDITSFFQKGRDLLVHAIGKKPVKKRRVRPLSL